MLGRLQRDVHPRLRAELPRPHAGAVDDVLGLDVAVRRVATPVTTPRSLQEPRDRRPPRGWSRPCMRAPLASAIVTSTGFTRPSSLT